ncbi:MAG TPA: nuclear transport factor 2 family protein [Acidimicrobiales bacterium]|nr:nuclear transport factor 2 family protein [Acidimicrobiales bacterium]
MSIETNKAIVRRFAQVWGKGDPSILDDLASADIRVSYPLMPAPAHGIEAFKEVLAVVHSAFPDIDCEVGDLIGRRRSCCGSLDPTW